MKNTEASYLFYSDYCEYSVEILQMINKYKLTCIKLICVDQVSQLPQVVDRVPLIITPSNKIVIDDDIVDYIESIHTKSFDSVSALIDDQSSSFSFIDENEDESGLTVTRTFNFISETNDNYVNKNSDMSFITNIETQSKGKIDKATIDKYIRERDIL